MRAHGSWALLFVVVFAGCAEPVGKPPAPSFTTPQAALADDPLCGERARCVIVDLDGTGFADEALDPRWCGHWWGLGELHETFPCREVAATGSDGELRIRVALFTPSEGERPLTRLVFFHPHYDPGETNLSVEWHASQD